MVRSLQAETGMTNRVVRRVVEQPGHWLELVLLVGSGRLEAGDGVRRGTTTSEAQLRRRAGTGETGVEPRVRDLQAGGDFLSGWSSIARSADSVAHRREQGRRGGRLWLGVEPMASKRMQRASGTGITR